MATQFNYTISTEFTGLTEAEPNGRALQEEIEDAVIAPDLVVMNIDIDGDNCFLEFSTDLSSPTEEDALDAVIAAHTGVPLPGSEAGGGSALIGQTWRFSTTTTDADPGNGRFRLNNATQDSSTALILDDLSRGGVDMTTILLQLQANDRIYIQTTNDHTQAHLVRVTGAPTDNAGWVTVPIAVESSLDDLDNNDECTVLFAFTGASGASGDHGALTGLGDDDHTQYLLVSGTRAMTGGLDMGGNAITNVGNVDGVDVSAHASRHISAGADEIDGDQIDIDWNPTNYTPTTSPTEVTSLDHLTAHLAGIDAELAGGGSGDVTAAANLANNALIRGDGGLKGIQDSGVIVTDSDQIDEVETLTFKSEHDEGTSGASATIDWNDGQHQTIELTANCTLSFTAPLGVGMFFLRVVQDAGGLNDITWPGTVLWPNGVSQSPSPVGDSETTYQIYYNGTNYYASIGGGLAGWS